MRKVVSYNVQGEERRKNTNEREENKSMVKFKTTKKEIMNGYWNVISVEYCELQHLLEDKNPIAYTCGKDGWHADIYQIDYSTVIVTGYAPFGNRNPSYDLCKKYDKYARDILYKGGECTQEKEKLDRLIGAFVEECLKLEK